MDKYPMTNLLNKICYDDENADVDNQNQTHMGVCLTKESESNMRESSTIETRNKFQQQELHYEDAELIHGTKVQLQDFEFLRVLGRGGYGKVMLVQQKVSKSYYAMKTLRKDVIAKFNSRNHTKNERDTLTIVDHPFIVRLHYAFQTKAKLYLILDFMIGGELFFHLRRAGRFDEEQAKFYTAEILLAIEYLHSKNIIYRDLKPENVLLDQEGHIKLTDFGLCKPNIGENDFATTMCGTFDYMAPEIYLQKGHNHTADWYSLGTMLYVMLAGVPPFYSVNKRQMMRDRLDKPIPMKENFSPETVDILKSLLACNPKQRLGAEGAQEIKSHPFFSSVPWDDLVSKKCTPPFIPKLLNQRDLRNFDNVQINFSQLFTDEKVRDTPVDVYLSNEQYDQFSYNACQMREARKTIQEGDLFLQLNNNFALK